MASEHEPRVGHHHPRQVDTPKPKRQPSKEKAGGDITVWEGLSYEMCSQSPRLASPLDPHAPARPVWWSPLTPCG